MAHQSLYRTHRPQSFKDLIGQEHVASALAEQIAGGRVGHAYLFAGSRGLGKTSVARILAKELKVSDRDLYEIDAASHNGVDYIRELSENIYTLPFESTYKLFILDEAHMLSKGAWNAFLKTLEEPPSYTIFILATTELEKVPETVQSRCQVFEFKKPSRAALGKLITDVAKKEGYAVEPAGAELLALLADGSYRDALSQLEKALAATDGKKLTLADVERATGAPKHALVLSFLAALEEKAPQSALVVIRKAVDQGVDLQLFLMLVLESLRTVLLIRHAPELRKELEGELGEDVYKEQEALAARSSSRLSHETLKALLDAVSRMRYAPVAALPLELAVLDLMPDGEEEA
ncbi:MAG TPA: DNA polymerase III subunit gamma/tau [Candidatus Paceibacterota bacterium]|nr:DNA polymerase III subunit gamma/tau [Candidatus Paceibacterota bacterium]